MILMLASCVLYAAAWIHIASRLKAREAIGGSIYNALLCGALLTHTASACMDVFSSSGLYFALFQAASLFLLCMNAIVYLSSLRKPLHSLFVLLLPLGAASVVSSHFLTSDYTAENLLSAGMLTHILLSVIAYSLLTIATLQALLLKYQNSLLKAHKAGKLVGVLPPLQTMEALLFELIWAGFALLSLSIATGFLFIDNVFAQQLSHKLVFSVSSWLIYAVLLWGRFKHGWRGAVAIRWTLIGFTALMLAYFGSKLVLELLLA